MIEDENLGRRAFGTAVVGNHGGMRRCGPVKRGKGRRRGFRTRDRECVGIGACPPRLYKAPNPHWLGISGARIVPRASRVRINFSSHAFIFGRVSRFHLFFSLWRSRVLRGVNESHRPHLDKVSLRYVEQCTSHEGRLARAATIPAPGWWGDSDPWYDLSGVQGGKRPAHHAECAAATSPPRSSCHFERADPSRQRDCLHQ